jgi:hypothetical protein
VPSYMSSPDDLVLHGPRVLGFASPARIATRFGLDGAFVAERLLDYEARGWVRHSAFDSSSGWSLTESGRTENERRLRLELDEARARDRVAALHAAFVPLNHQFGTACTNWAWDEAVLKTLARLGGKLRQLCDELTQSLQRFDGYADRFSSALANVDAGQRRWVDSPEIDSCHTVWIQFHEDLLATLGIPRGAGV